MCSPTFNKGILKSLALVLHVFFFCFLKIINHSKAIYCDVNKRNDCSDCCIIFCKPSLQVNNLIYNITEWPNINIIATIRKYLKVHPLQLSTLEPLLISKPTCPVLHCISNQDIFSGSNGIRIDWLQEKKELVHWSLFKNMTSTCLVVLRILNGWPATTCFHSYMIGFMRTFGMVVHI